MSINFTFAAADGDTAHIGIPCACRSKLLCSCEDFDHYNLCEHTGDGVCEHNRFDVAMSGSNGNRVLTALDIFPDSVGVFSASEFRTRLVAVPNVHRRFELMRLAQQAEKNRLNIGWC